MNDQKVLETVKQVLELVEKAPKINKLKKQLLEIAGGQRKEISKEVIDDAFDAMEIIVKNIGCTPDDVSKVQKLVFRELVYRMILNQNVYIRK